MKKIMIIGAGDFQLPLVQRAAERFHVVLVAPEIDDRFKAYAQACYYYDVRDKKAILEVARKEQIDGVITDQTDIPVRTVAYVAENMGLPGIGYETAKIFTDKALMRKRMVEAGLQVIPYIETTDCTKAMEFFHALQAPVILKPTDTQGSRGVIRVDNKEQLTAAFEQAQQYSSTRTVVVEKYIVGEEVVIEGITANSKLIGQICGDTIYFDDTSKFSAKKRIFPSSKSKAIVQKAMALNRDIIQAFGLNNGITHGEYIIEGDTVYLIEIAARGGGVFISSDLIHETTGLDTESFLLDIACEAKAAPTICDTAKVAGYRAFYLPTGTVMQIEGLEKVKEMPFLRRHQLDKIQIGLKIGENTNKTSRFAFIIVANSWEEWQKCERFVKDTLIIKTELNGKQQDIIWE